MKLQHQGRRIPGLVVAIACRLQTVDVKFIGTHHPFDAIGALTIEPS